MFREKAVADHLNFCNMFNQNLLSSTEAYKASARVLSVFAFFFLFICQWSFAQHEQLGIGGTNREDCRRAAIIADSILVSVGLTRTYGPGSQNAYIALSKFDGNAENGFFCNDSTSLSERFNGIAPLSSGSFLLTGNAVNGDYGYLTHGRIDNDDLVLNWSRRAVPTSGVSFWNAVELPDGRIAFTGWYVHSTDDLLFGLLDSLGNVDWITTYDRAGDEDRSFAINPSLRGESIFAAGKTNISGDFQGYVARIDTTDGSILWANDFGGTSDEYLFAVKNTLDSNIIAAGYTESYGAGDRDIFMVKMDTLGSIIWAKAIGTPGFENCSDLIVMDDGGFLLAGNSNQTGTNADYLLVRTDADGNVSWAKTYGSNAGNERLSSLSRASQNRFILSGHSNSFGSSNEHYLVYVDSMGLGTCLFDTLAFSSADVSLTTSTGYSFEGNVALGPWDPAIDSGMVQFDPCDILTLPVSILNQELDCEDGYTTVRWSTLSEKDNMEFRVYRYSSTGIPSLLGIVQGAGNSSHQIFYEFEDQERTDPESFYRIVQVDFDGETTEYPFLSAKECNSSIVEPTMIYENNGVRIILPENDFTMIRSMEFTFMDMKGSIIHSESILVKPHHDTYYVSLDKMLSSGIYMSSVNLNAQDHSVQRFTNKLRVDN